MPAYRCYFIDRENHIGGMEIIKVSGDAEAMRAADRLLADRPDFHGVEVWERARRVTARL
jgi:hypothetical protein